MNKLKLFLAVAIVMLVAGCNDRKQKPQTVDNDDVEVADSTVYGVCGRRQDGSDWNGDC